MPNKERILIVDDDSDHLKICNLLFERRGFEVLPILGCEQMEDLIGVIDTFKPGLIFMDHFMPGVCGMDAIKSLKSNPAYSSIPIIYFSNHDDLERVANEAGADGYFKKPFRAESLIQIAKSKLSI